MTQFEKTVSHIGHTSIIVIVVTYSFSPRVPPSQRACTSCATLTSCISKSSVHVSPGAGPEAGTGVMLLVVLLLAPFLLSSVSSKSTHIECVHVCFFYKLGISLLVVFFNLIDVVVAFASSERSRFLTAFACLVSYSITPVAFSFESSLASVSSFAFLSVPFALVLCFAFRASWSSRCFNPLGNILRLAPHGQSTWLWAGSVTSS